jgi:Domain of unknown function (DUF4394)
MVLSAVGTIGTVLALQATKKPAEVTVAATDPELVSYDGQDRRGGDFRIYGLTGGKTLVSVRGDDPDKIRGIGDIKGLQGDTTVVGIDFRVQDGKLYGVGDKGGIYTISTDNAKAVKVSQLTVALSGTTFDIDFNPAANRLRVVSDNGQNLRHNIDDPAGAPAANTTATDTALTTPPTAGNTAGVTGAAYTNNDLNADTATTLYDLSTMTDQILVQSPANNGTLAATGKLMVDAAGDAGFDIASTLRGGVTVGNAAFASLKVDGRYRLYRVDLLTGRAGNLGSFPSRTQVTDIAIQTDR